MLASWILDAAAKISHQGAGAEVYTNRNATINGNSQGRHIGKMSSQ